MEPEYVHSASGATFLPSGSYVDYLSDEGRWAFNVPAFMLRTVQYDVYGHHIEVLTVRDGWIGLTEGHGGTNLVLGGKN